MTFLSRLFGQKEDKKDLASQDTGNCALEEMQDHITQKITNSYKARSHNFNGEKSSGGMNYDSAHGADISVMRERSVKAYNTSMPGRAAIKRLTDTVINTGLSLESTPETSILGLSQEERKTISNKIESRFKLWSTSKNCDFSKENTLGQIERIQNNNQLVKGDFFGALIFSDDPTLINPLQIKIINPDRVATPFDQNIKKTAEDKGNRIIDGIELNENDEEVAIHIKSKKAGSFQNEWFRLPKIGPVSGRTVLIHGKTQEFGFEPRGIPALAHVAHELEKVTDYSLLELMAAVANATVAMVVEPGENAPATNPFSNNTFVPPNLVKESLGWDATTSDLDPGYTNLGKTVLKDAGGLLVSSLNQGEKLVSHDTKRPNVNFEQFVDSIIKYLASSLSMPIEVLHMTFGKNFSASRASLKMFWQSIDVRRNDFISDHSTIVYNAWLLGEVGMGNLILKGYEDPSLRAAWQSARWVGINSPSIDPDKEAKAAERRISAGSATREYESQLYNGSSYDSNVERLITENARLAEAKKPLVDLEKGDVSNGN